MMVWPFSKKRSLSLSACSVLIVVSLCVCLSLWYQVIISISDHCLHFYLTFTDVSILQEILRPKPVLRFMSCTFLSKIRKMTGVFCMSMNSSGQAPFI